MATENQSSQIKPTVEKEDTAEDQEAAVREHSKSGANQKRKKYLIEFFMIFLAVTMGFFAESYREKLSDQSREREYIAQLINDLKEDRAECDANNVYSVVTINSKIGHYCTDLIDILSKENPSKKEITTAYHHYQVVTEDWFMAYFKDATWLQMKINGGYKDVHPKVISEVNEYYKWASVINDYKDEIKKRQSAITYNEGRKVFDHRMAKGMVDSIDSKFITIIFEPVNSNVQYLNDSLDIQFALHDKQTILQLCNDLRSYRSLLILYNGMVKEQGVRAEKLVHMIMEEYRLKD